MCNKEHCNCSKNRCTRHDVRICRGPRGRSGSRGPTGVTGPSGSVSLSGPTGAQGAVGPTGPATTIFATGATGAIGSTGAQGPTTALSYADFYALMPGDNATTVGLGTDVSFPQNGPQLGSDIVRANASSFNLVAIGTYQILFQVSVNEPGQLVVSLNNLEQTYTTVGRATGTSQLVGVCLVQTSTVNSLLTIRNPSGNSTALTITPFAGGTNSVSAHLVITRLS